MRRAVGSLVVENRGARIALSIWINDMRKHPIVVPLTLTQASEFQAALRAIVKQARTHAAAPDLRRGARLAGAPLKRHTLA